MRSDPVVAGGTAARRDQLNVLASLAAIALLLAGVGIHGLLAYTVAQRSREIGVRMALGARPWEVARLVVGEGLVLAVIGIVLGVAAASGAARWMSSLLFGVSPADAVTLVAAVGLGLAMTLTGSIVPTWRAARVSPLTAMRTE